MTKWEYQAGDYDSAFTSAELNAEGAQGWDLVGFTVTPWSQVNERKGYTDTGTSYHYVFKRQLPQPSEDTPQ